MSAYNFYRSKVLQQTYNIPQMIPGGVTVTFQFSVFLSSLLIPTPSIALGMSNIFAEIDSIPTVPDTLSMSIPVPTISVLVTSP